MPLFAILTSTSPTSAMMVRREWMWLSEVKYNLVLTWRPGEETPEEYLGLRRLTQSLSLSSVSMFR